MRILVSVCIAAFAAQWPLAAQSQPATEEEIFEIQFLLNKLGFKAGKPNGKVGRKLRVALRQLSEREGTDYPTDARTLAYLRAREEAGRSLSDVGSSDEFVVVTENGRAAILSIPWWGYVSKQSDIVVSSAGPGLGCRHHPRSHNDRSCPIWGRGAEPLRAGASAQLCQDR